jgi:hypothetical protein
MNSANLIYYALVSISYYEHDDGAGKVAGPSFYIPPNFAQRPDFCKNFVTVNSFHFYEFGTHRNRGRSKKAQGTESPKINVVDEEEYFLEEESIDNSVDNFDDGNDEDYSPKSETRLTRSSSKIDEQKPKATYEAETTYKDSDVSINSSGSIYIPTIKGFSRKILEVK